MTFYKDPRRNFCFSVCLYEIFFFLNFFKWLFKCLFNSNFNWIVSLPAFFEINNNNKETRVFECAADAEMNLLFCRFIYHMYLFISFSYSFHFSCLLLSLLSLLPTTSELKTKVNRDEKYKETISARVLWTLKKSKIEIFLK